MVSILPHDKVRIYNHACDRHMNGLIPMKLDGGVFSILSHDKVRIYNHACDRHMNGLTPNEVGCGCLAFCLMTKGGYEDTYHHHTFQHCVRVMLILI